MSSYTQFLIGDWDPTFAEILGQETYFLSQVWGQLVALKLPPADADGECLAVAKKATEEFRTKERILEIEAQNGDWSTIVFPVAQALPDAPASIDAWPKAKPKTWCMLQLALHELQPGLYFQKNLINRARPDRTCSGLPRTVIPTPGHPSYPAGHAAQAYTAALLLATLFPDTPTVSTSLLGAAARVADNRVVAGIHFPSDCEAGRQLALKFVPLLLSQSAFQQLLSDAAAEWQAKH